MRLRLVLLLLVLLPFLSIWNAASAYCGDESDARAQHLGHHVDKHHDDDPSGPSGDQVAEGDCDHCHSPGAMLPGLACDGRLAAPDLPVRWTDVMLRAPPVAPPERPKWVRLA